MQIHAELSHPPALNLVTVPELNGKIPGSRGAGHGTPLLNFARGDKAPNSKVWVDEHIPAPLRQIPPLSIPSATQVRAL